MTCWAWQREDCDRPIIENRVIYEPAMVLRFPLLDSYGKATFRRMSGGTEWETVNKTMCVVLPEWGDHAEVECDGGMVELLGENVTLFAMSSECTEKRFPIARRWIFTVAYTLSLLYAIAAALRPIECVKGDVLNRLRQTTFVPLALFLFIKFVCGYSGTSILGGILVHYFFLAHCVIQTSCAVGLQHCKATKYLEVFFIVVCIPSVFVALAGIFSHWRIYVTPTYRFTSILWHAEMDKVIVTFPILVFTIITLVSFFKIHNRGAEFVRCVGGIVMTLSALYAAAECRSFLAVCGLAFIPLLISAIHYWYTTIMVPEMGIPVPRLTNHDVHHNSVPLLSNLTQETTIP